MLIGFSFGIFDRLRTGVEFGFCYLKKQSVKFAKKIKYSSI